MSAVGENIGVSAAGEHMGGVFGAGTYIRRVSAAGEDVGGSLK